MGVVSELLQGLILEDTHILVHQGQSEFTIIGKTSIQGPFAKVSRLGNGSHTDLGHAMLGKETLGRDQYQLPIGYGVNPFGSLGTSVTIYRLDRDDLIIKKRQQMTINDACEARN